MTDSLPSETSDLQEIKTAVGSKRLFQAKVIRPYSRKNALVSMGGILALLVREVPGKFRLFIDQRINVRIKDVDEESQHIFVTDDLIDTSDFNSRASELQIGNSYRGIVLSLTSYGIFVQVRGLSGLAHVKELSWRANDHSALARYKAGMRISVTLKAINYERELLILSVKDHLPDPFIGIQSSFAEDPSRVYYGEIVNIMDYGLFIDLDRTGVQGLIHVSKLFETPQTRLSGSDKKYFRSITDIPVIIHSIDKLKRHVSIFCADKGLPNPHDVEETEFVGEMAGRINKLSDSEIEIALSNGITGLIVRDDGEAKFEYIILTRESGDTINVTCGLYNVQRQKRILVPTLSLPLEDEIEFVDIVENFRKGRSIVDLDRKQYIALPYYELSSHLQYLAGSRNEKVFDYIYHFGCISEVDELKVFGLLHRSSIEFRLRRYEFGLSLFVPALELAIAIKSRRLTKTALNILRRHRAAIMGEN